MKKKDENNRSSLLTRETGYAVPDGYFDTLADRIADSVGIEEYDLKDLPDNYFDELPGRIINKAKKAQVIPKVVYMAGWKKYVAIAASLALFVVGYHYYSSDTVDIEDMVASDALILEYLNEYDIDIEAATLSQLEIIREEFNMTDVVEESDELYEYYLEYHIDDLATNELEGIIK